MGHHEVASLSTDDHPAGSLEARYGLRAGDDGEHRHDACSDGELDYLDRAPIDPRVSFDVQPTIDRLADVRNRVIAIAPLAGAAGKLGALGDDVSILAGIENDSDRHSSHGRGVPPGSKVSESAMRCHAGAGSKRSFSVFGGTRVG
jgi:hypothetical protein